MPVLSKVVAKLRAERKVLASNLDRLDRAIGVLTNVDGASRRTRVGGSAGKPRRTMSAAARKRIAAAQRARWAKFRRETGKK